jgi:polyhydroxybutyrate depolymerase
MISEKRFEAKLPLLALMGVMLITAMCAHGQETTEKVTVDDVERRFLVRLPRGYTAEQHYPVVILLHGLNQDADDMERITQFDAVADKDGIITVYPSALHGRWNVGVQPQQHRSMGMGPGGPGRRRGYPGGGYPGGGYPGGGGGGYPGSGQPRNRMPEEEKRPAPADDIGFFNQMLDSLKTKFSVDQSRIYVIGLSEGGFMSLHAGCTISDRIAAVATVGAAMPKTMICLPSRPVSLLMINGTSDPVVPYGGGTEHNMNLSTLSAEDSAKAWAKIDHCSDKPERSKQGAHAKGGSEAKIDTYNSCGQASQVQLYSIKGAGNTWPGGAQYEPENAVGKTSADINGDELIWNFLVTRKLVASNDSKP